MIKWLIPLFISIPAFTGAEKLPDLPKPYEKVYRHILKNKPTLDLAYADSLAKAIYAASTKYNINPIKMSAILRQESGYKLDAINNISKDYSIGQINHKTIKAFNFDKNRLLTDLEYSVEAAVIVLADIKRMFAHKEDDWFCRYNTGTAQRLLIEDKCRQYKILVMRYM